MGQIQDEVWWSVIKTLAGLVACGVEYAELNEPFIKECLEQGGFSDKEIGEAFDWLDMAANSGQIGEVLAMLQPASPLVRVPSPLETVCISEEFFSQFDEMRNRGIISFDLAEKILEGIRTLDTRDWESEDIKNFFLEVISATVPYASFQTIEQLLKKRLVPQFYS